MQGGLVGSVCFLVFLLALDTIAQNVLSTNDLNGSVLKKSTAYHDNDNTKSATSDENIATEVDSSLGDHSDKNNLSDSQVQIQSENLSLPDSYDQSTVKGLVLDEITPQVFGGDQYRANPGYNALQFLDNSPSILSNSRETNLKDSNKISTDMGTNDDVNERRSSVLAYASTDDEDPKLQALASSPGFERAFGPKVIQYLNGLGYPNLGINSAQPQAIKGRLNPYNSGYMRSPYNLGYPSISYKKNTGQTYGDATNKANVGGSFLSEQNNNGFGSVSPEFEAISLSSAEAAINSMKYGQANAVYSRVILQNELVLPHQIPGAENAIKCSKEGEMYNMWAPPYQCMVCACVKQGRFLRPVCTSCTGCMNPNMQPDKSLIPTEDLMVPTEQVPLYQPDSQVSCDPLPMNRPFQNPLNPCQICVCRGNSAQDDIQIICQENPQCVIPPDIATIPPIPVPPVPVPLPTCTMLPKNVMFPHPQDRCKICKCINHASQLGITVPRVMCVPKPECGIKPGAPPVTFPEMSMSPQPIPYPNLNLSSTEFLLLNPELLPVQSESPISNSVIFTTPEGAMTPDAQQTSDFVPISPIPLEEDSGSPKKNVFPQPSSGSIIIQEDTKVPWLWPPRPNEPEQHRGPLPGPPPHDSCRPYPPNTPFQHPWDNCQTCVCSEFHSSGHTTIEVNCYTKPSCCVEQRITSTSVSGSKLESMPPPVPNQGPLQIVDQICEFKSFGAEFVNARDNCQICTCELLGNLVVPVCKRTNRPECTMYPAPTPSVRVVYIEPKCKYRLPHQPFDVNCNSCVCLPVYNFVIAKCTLRPNCRKLPSWPGIGLGSPSTQYSNILQGNNVISSNDSPTSPNFTPILDGSGNKNLAEGLGTIPDHQVGPSYMVASPSQLREPIPANQLLTNNKVSALTQLRGTNYTPGNSVLGQVPFLQSESGNLWSDAQVNENAVGLNEDQFSQNYQNPLQTAQLTNAAASADALTAANVENEYNNYNLFGNNGLPQSHIDIGPGTLPPQKSRPSQPVSILSPGFYQEELIRVPPPEGSPANDANSNRYSHLPNRNAFPNSPNVPPEFNRLQTIPETSTNYRANGNPQFLDYRPSESYKNVDMSISSDFESPFNKYYKPDRYSPSHVYPSIPYHQSNSAPEILAASDMYETLYQTPYRQSISDFSPGRYDWSNSAQAIDETSPLGDPSTQNNYAQAQLNTGRPAARPGRGKCHYEGDMYHEKCQACYCLRDSNGDLYSMCLGNPCTN